jgi:energy-coupling factor transporter transmembrane protein EcfT
MRFLIKNNHLVNFILLILVSSLAIVFSYKESGGDIFALIIIFSLALLLLIIGGILRIFVTYKFWKTVLWIFLGLIVSLIIFKIANEMATK